MKTYLISLSLGLLMMTGCNKSETADVKPEGPNPIQGTWKMIYAEIRENDSVQVKDLSNTDFIKIINADHFAFFNQDRGTGENFMSGAGSYTFNGKDYTETLDFISLPELRGHEFPFEVRISGDTLVQQGHEKVEEAGLDRYILEKYVRIEK